MGRIKDGSDITEGSEGKEGKEGSETFEVSPLISNISPFSSLLPIMSMNELDKQSLNLYQETLKQTTQIFSF